MVHLDKFFMPNPIMDITPLSVGATFVVLGICLLLGSRDGNKASKENKKNH